MASRGLWQFMSARTRRGLALSWSALFVLSLLMQYFSFALASPALAAHNEGIFELDGNATDSAAAGADWQNGPEGALDDFFVGAAQETPANDVTYFTTGGSKDENDIPAWEITDTSAPDKDELLDAYAAVYEQGGDTWVYFGADRFDNDGTAQIGFWFFQDNVGIANDDFTGEHVDGDILIISEYTNGGVVSEICAYEWDGSGGGANIAAAGGCDKATSGSNLNLVAAGSSCDVADGSFEICAVTNEDSVDAPWPFTNKDGETDFGPGQFFEGGINLSDLFGGDPPCFGTFLAETRSSAETDAQLKDFALGSLNTCVPPTLTTDASTTTWNFGDAAVTDTATLSGNDGPASGKVKFFVCTPAQITAAGCPTGGTQVGADAGVTVATTANGGTATSAGFTPTAVGKYCFRAEYIPDAASQYLATSHTNATSECFTVVKNNTTIVTSANQSVNVGAAIADSATLSGATADAGGSITFKAYGPGDDDCNGTAAFTSNAIAVSGNGTYGPVSFTPDTAGVYYWIATYTGDARNEGSTHACGATGEVDTVNKVNPTIATQASGTVVVGGQISDTATVSGGLNPTGTVSFKLFGPDNATCAGDPIFTSNNRALSGGSATSASFTTTQAGTYRWIATYNGDANNNSVAGACNDANENVIVTKASPTIATVLVGGGEEGASITVPLGTAVHDTSTLTGATATAGGTVHYQVYANAQCTGTPTEAGTIDVVNGVPGNSINITFDHAGTFYWQATYSGDANNNGALSPCNLEVVTVDKDIPSISTQASGTVQVGGSISDTATLSNGTLPTGTITFSLYGPDNATCTGVAIFTSAKTVNGNGDYVSDSFTTTAAGTYRWIAAYSGDGDNAAVSGACNDANESVVVTKKAPAVVTNASDDVTIGGSIHDVATLSGATATATGSITFTLYGPNNATCTGDPIFTSTKSVAGNGDYTSDGFTPTTAGVYRWIANYGGDANNTATANGCNGANENVTVNKANPTVTTNASASVTVGGAIWDTATLAGGVSPTGTITFNLYGPDNATCAGEPIFTSSKTVTGNGQYVSDSYTTTAAGTYRWIANYGGDTNNNATANACNAANENVVVTKANPAIATLATEGAQVGDQVHDTATVTGGFNPTGTVTFKLYGPGDGECDGSAIFTDTVDLEDDGTATSGDFTVTEKGSYHWVASYSGDANNASATGACGDEGETTVVNQFNPDITTVLTSGNTSGAKITVLFGASVTDQATLTGASATAGGTVTYTVYRDDECTDEFADAGSKTVTNGVVPASNAVTFPDAGTYYWQASYGGDAANAPAISPCTDEVLTVTTPDLNVTKLVKTNDGSFGPTSTAEPGDTLTFQITITNTGNAAATNVPVSDDIADVLAHATYNADCSNSCTVDGSTLKWTIPSIAANGGSVTLTFSVDLDDTFPVGTTHLPNVVIVTGPGSNCPEASTDPDCDTDTTVQAQPDLNVTKLVATGDTTFAPTSEADPGDVVNFQITITNTGNAAATNVPVSDNIAAVLAHADYNNDCSNSCTVDGTTLKWTIPSIAANGGSVTLTFSVTLDSAFPAGTTTLPNVVVVTGPGSNCPAASTDHDCDTTTTVTESVLGIDKSMTGNSAGTDPILNVPAARIGDTLTYTLTYTGEGPITGAVITDVLPIGLAYIAGSAEAGDNDSDFTFVSYNAATRTLTWRGNGEDDSIPDPAEGSVSYKVTVLAAAPARPQPLINTATIDSDQTPPDSDTQRVSVLAPPLQLTPPPTTTLTPETGSSNPGFALMLILIGVAGLTLGIGFVTPAPARVRRRDRLG